MVIESNKQVGGFWPWLVRNWNVCPLEYVDSSKSKSFVGKGWFSWNSVLKFFWKKKFKIIGPSHFDVIKIKNFHFFWFNATFCLGNEEKEKQMKKVKIEMKHLELIKTLWLIRSEFFSDFQFVKKIEISTFHPIWDAKNVKVSKILTVWETQVYNLFY